METSESPRDSTGPAQAKVALTRWSRRGFDRMRLGLWALVVLGVRVASAQGQAPLRQAPDLPSHVMPHVPTPFYGESSFHVAVGLALAVGAIGLYRYVRARREMRRAPTGYASVAVLSTDLVESTRLAVHHGDAVAMRARNALDVRTRAQARAWRATSIETTGDGCLITFPSVEAATRAAMCLLRDLRDRPPDPSPAIRLAVRAGISYGEVLIDARGMRHGAALNRAVRLQTFTSDQLVRVETEGDAPHPFPPHDRILVDEEAVQEIRRSDIRCRFAGYGQLKGFSGLHRVYEVEWEHEDSGPQPRTTRVTCSSPACDPNHTQPIRHGRDLA